MLQKLAFLIVPFLLVGISFLVKQRDRRRWFQLHAMFIQEGAMSSDVDLLLLGDSITAGWRSKKVMACWTSQYHDLKVANFAISGDCTWDILWRLRNGELAAIKPKLVILLAGVNDLMQAASPAQVVDLIFEISDEIQSQLPESRMLVLSLFPSLWPSSLRRKRIDAVNNLLSSRIGQRDFPEFLDIHSCFLDPNGRLSMRVMPDLLHLSPGGYQIWASAMAEVVSTMLPMAPRGG